MKQIAGISAVVAIAVAAVRLPSGAPEPPQANITLTAPALHRAAAPSPMEGQPYRGGCTAFLPALSGARPPAEQHDSNRGAANSVLQNFFGPLQDRSKVRYAIALAPDPLHTNLSLWFDREIVAIQQAAQDEEFAYNSSWLPWKTGPETYEHLEDRQLAEELTGQREACPGVLLFRRGLRETPLAHDAAQPRPPSPYAEALVVLVVGEQPTGGMNEQQWANAIVWLRQQSAFSQAHPLSILGPSFSGSLVSLERALEQLSTPSPAAPAGAATIFPPVNILTGSVTGCSSIQWFQQSLNRHDPHNQSVFGSFQENDELQIYRLLNYLSQQGYRSKPDAANSSVAVLSEDETAYAANPAGAESIPASAPVAGSPAPCSFAYAAPSQPLRLAYPRDISAVRNAYEKQSVFGGGAASHASHAVLQATSLESQADTASDTVRGYSAGMSAVAQEAVLYGIVSYLRAHHTEFLVLRCTNPLDFLFLTRFFHRAYPEGRVVTVSSDLLFRREIDTTEFRGVLSVSNYPLLPSNQHWSHVESTTTADSAGHTHRIFDSELQGIYLAARYLFDGQPLLAGPPSPDHRSTVLLRAKSAMPEIAPPFWLPENRTYQPPTWLSVVGRDGYWPVAVLNDDTLPGRQRLDLARRPSASDRGAPPPPPPVTLVSIDRGNLQHDRSIKSPPIYPHSMLFKVPNTLQIMIWCAMLLLCYQLFGLWHGQKYTSIGLFSLFRNDLTPSHAVLLGMNCAFAGAILVQLLWAAVNPHIYDNFVERFADVNLVLGLSATILVALAISLFLIEFKKGTGLAALLPFLAIFALLTLGPWLILYTFRIQANAIPLFYRMAHLVSGVSPLPPVLLLVVGFYFWTWQAMAGSSMLLNGHPLLPRKQRVLPIMRGAEDNQSQGRLRLLRTIAGLRLRLRYYYLSFLGIDLAGSEDSAAHLLTESEYRISGEMAKHILKAASPLSIEPRILFVPFILLVVAGMHGFFSSPPLLGLESHRFATWINTVLLIAFLLTTAEAGRLFFTWVELRRLLTALNRQRLRRTFAKLRAISVGSLWSVSGSVPRIQYLFLAHQLDAASSLTRLLARSSSLVVTQPAADTATLAGAQGLASETWDRSRTTLPPSQPATTHWLACPLTVRAVAAGRAFASDNAAKLESGPHWELPVKVDAVKYPDLAGLDCFYIREVLNDAVGEIINQILLPAWRSETHSLNLQTRPATADEHERNAAEMELSDDPVVRAGEEFVCIHYIAFIQNILCRMRTMILSMVSLFVAVCFAISFYPFVPRTQTGLWMMLNLFFIAGAVIYVYAGMEHDETLSYITNTSAAKLSSEFYLKTAAFLAGPVIGLITTQFPSISESFLGWIQPGFDALK